MVPGAGCGSGTDGKTPPPPMTVPFPAGLCSGPGAMTKSLPFGSIPINVRPRTY